jgi:hypothetical protein
MLQHQQKGRVNQSSSNAEESNKSRRKSSSPDKGETHSRNIQHKNKHSKLLKKKQQLLRQISSSSKNTSLSSSKTKHQSLRILTKPPSPNI